MADLTEVQPDPLVTHCGWSSSAIEHLVRAAVEVRQHRLYRNGACSLLCRRRRDRMLRAMTPRPSGVMLVRLIDAATDHPESATWAQKLLGSLHGVVGYLAEVSGS